MEQPETCRTPAALGIRQVFGKKDQISGIFSPKLTLCRAGNNANLVFLPGSRQVSDCSITDGPQGI